MSCTNRCTNIEESKRKLAQQVVLAATGCLTCETVAYVDVLSRHERPDGVLAVDVEGQLAVDERSPAAVGAFRAHNEVVPREDHLHLVAL